MKKYESRFDESKGGDKVYKARGIIIKDIEKVDMSQLSPQEKGSIKDRLKQISKELK